MNINQNIEDYNKAKLQVEEHCMCFDLIIEKHYAIILYPEGVCSLGGLRVDNSKKGLGVALQYMEQHWLADHPLN